MSRAQGRSVSTERFLSARRYIREAEAQAQAQGEAEDLGNAPMRRRLGFVALEVMLIALLGIGLGTTALHLVRPESACASCAVEISAK